MIYENAELLLSVNLSLAFKEKLILRGIVFDVYNTVQPSTGIPRPQVLALLGPSGVGKTQLFRCIAGLQVPTEGAVFVNADDHPVYEGEVGVVAQDYPLIETRTVMGNLVRAFQVNRKCHSNSNHFLVILGGLMTSIKNAFVEDEEAKEMALGYLERFGLTEISGQYPCELSGGQRQRIAIIQQMMCSKHFLLMDEPFSGLDIVAKDQAINLITEMAAADELNTVIVTTHDIRSACAVADRVILLGRDRDSDGNIIPGARIIADIDLKTEDLCWIPGITMTPKFLEFVATIEQKFYEL